MRGRGVMALCVVCVLGGGALQRGSVSVRWVRAFGRLEPGAWGACLSGRKQMEADPFGRPRRREAKAMGQVSLVPGTVPGAWGLSGLGRLEGARGGRSVGDLPARKGARGLSGRGTGAWLRGYPVVRRWPAEACRVEPVEVCRAAEPACAKAAGRLWSPGQCDGAGGGSRRSPRLGLRAGLGPGAVLSVWGGPAVEVSAGRAGGWFLDEGCPSFAVKKFSIPWGPRVVTHPLVPSGTHGVPLVISTPVLLH